MRVVADIGLAGGFHALRRTRHMYPLALVVALVLVTLSPLALDRWLTFREQRDARIRYRQERREANANRTLALEQAS